MTGRLTIGPDGIVTRTAPHVPLVTGFSFVSLEGITYQR